MKKLWPILIVAIWLFAIAGSGFLIIWTVGAVVKIGDEIASRGLKDIVEQIWEGEENEAIEEN